jgi:DNA-binding Xre family transcriptional regulator
MIYYKGLKKLFEGSGYSYKQLGEILGIHWVTLNRLANAEDCEAYNISLKAIDKICAYFRVQPGDILIYRK